MNKVLLRKLLARNVVSVALHYCSKGHVKGYDVLRMVEEDFGVRLTPAVLYNCLKNLECDGLLCSDRASAFRVYGVTEKGQACLVESVRELRVLLQTLSNGVK